MHTWQDDEYTTETPSTGNPSKDDRVRQAVALIEGGPGVADRARGVERLGELRANYDLVKRSAHSKAARIRSAAAGVLGNFPDEDIAPLVASLLADANPHVRSGAIVSAGRAGLTELFPAILERLDDPDERPQVHCAALVAGARLARTPEEVEAVAEYTDLATGSLAYRDSSIAALGILGDPESLAELRDLLDQSVGTPFPERLAAQLVRALGRHYDPAEDLERVLAAAGGLPGGRGEAVRLLARQPTEACRSAFEHAVCESNGRVVEAAIGGLRAIGLDPSLTRLRDLLGTSQVQRPFAVLRQLARDPAGVGLLADLAGAGPMNLRGAALRYLAQGDPTRARAVAARLGDAGDPLVRREVERLEGGRGATSRLRILLVGDPEGVAGLGAAVAQRGHELVTGPDQEPWHLAILLDGAGDSLPPGAVDAVVVDATTGGARAQPGRHPVVKALATPPPEAFASLNLRLGRPLAPLCGDDPVAVRLVERLLVELGCHPLVVGGLDEAPHLEALGRYARLLGQGAGSPSDRLIGVIGRA